MWAVGRRTELEILPLRHTRSRLLPADGVTENELRSEGAKELRNRSNLTRDRSVRLRRRSRNRVPKPELATVVPTEHIQSGRHPASSGGKSATGTFLSFVEKKAKRQNYDHGRTRTCSLLIRSQALYPMAIEPHGHFFLLSFFRFYSAFAETTSS